MSKDLEMKKEDEKALDTNPLGKEVKQEVETQIKDVPYDVFKAKNDEAKALKKLLAEQEEALKEAQAEQEERARKELEAKQEWETLYKENTQKLGEIEPQLASLQEAHQNALEIITKDIESKMELVPELYRPLLQSMSPIDQFKWLSENSDKIASSKASGIPQTPDAQGQPSLTDEERRKRAVRTF